MTFTQNGGAYWQEKINAAEQTGSRQCTITGNWEIEQTIVLPSDFTLYLDDCHLQMGAGTFCNMFTNRAKMVEGRRTAAQADHNIRIVGRGRAILDGGEYNGLSERNYGKNGLPHISVNNLLLFVNVDGFSISDIHVRNQRWWALNFIYCCHGVIRQVDICADDGLATEDGIRMPNLTLKERKNFPNSLPYICNADGIDLRVGCHDIIIENITGFTQDDTVALTGLTGSLETMYAVEDLSTDMYNIIVRNVNSTAACSNVRLLNQSGVKLYNVLVDGVMDASANSPHVDRGIFAVRIGDNRMYGTRHSTPEETKNITIRNIYGRGQAVVELAGSITNLVMDNICGFDTCETVIHNDAKLYPASQE